MRCKILPKSVPFFMALGYSNDLLPRLPTSTQRKKIKHQACIKIPASQYVVYRTPYSTVCIDTFRNTIINTSATTTIHHLPSLSITPQYSISTWTSLSLPFELEGVQKYLATLPSNQSFNNLPCRWPEEILHTLLKGTSVLIRSCPAGETGFGK